MKTLIFIMLWVVMCGFYPLPTDLEDCDSLVCPRGFPKQRIGTLCYCLPKIEPVELTITWDNEEIDKYNKSLGDNCTEGWYYYYNLPFYRQKPDCPQPQEHQYITIGNKTYEEGVRSDGMVLRRGVK